MCRWEWWWTITVPFTDYLSFFVPFWKGNYASTRTFFKITTAKKQFCLPFWSEYLLHIRDKVWLKSWNIWCKIHLVCWASSCIDTPRNKQMALARHRDHLLHLTLTKILCIYSSPVRSWIQTCSCCSCTCKEQYFHFIWPDLLSSSINNLQPLCILHHLDMMENINNKSWNVTSLQHINKLLMLSIHI